MSGGRTMWLAQDAARHRRALMVELRAEHGPVALACDVVLCAHAKEQNDGGAIRDGFAAVAAEAGCARDEARAFIVDAAGLGWLDDLEIDPDGRRFRCRISGWRSDQDKAYAAWRKRDQRTRDTDGDMSPAARTNGDMSRAVTRCPPTAQHSTEELPPLTPPQAGGKVPPVPAAPLGKRSRELARYDSEVAAYAAALLPDVAEPQRTQMVRSALGWLRDRGDVTDDAVRAYTRRWTGDSDHQDAAA